MSTARTSMPGAPDSWVLTICRAISALVLGLTITFSQNHSARLGLISFGVFALVTAIPTLVSVRYADREIRPVTLLQGALLALAGGLAFALLENGVTVFVAVVSGWALLTGSGDLLNGFRFRDSRLIARDWLISGVATFLLGVLFLLIPRDLAIPYEAGNGAVSGMLTADVVLVGILGTWAVIVGVLFTIATFGLFSVRKVSVRQLGQKR